MDIQPLLREKRIRQSDLAEYLGISQPTVSRWLREGVPAEHVASVSSFTGIKPADIRPDLAETFGRARR